MLPALIGTALRQADRDVHVGGQTRHAVEDRGAGAEQIPRYAERGCSAGTSASGVTSRRKDVERLQTTELARSNIQRSYLEFSTRRPSGKVVLECDRLATGSRPEPSGACASHLDRLAEPRIRYCLCVALPDRFRVGDGCDGV